MSIGWYYKVFKNYHIKKISSIFNKIQKQNKKKNIVKNILLNTTYNKFKSVKSIRRDSILDCSTIN